MGKTICDLKIGDVIYDLYKNEVEHLKITNTKSVDRNRKRPISDTLPIDEYIISFVGEDGYEDDICIPGDMSIIKTSWNSYIYVNPKDLVEELKNRVVKMEKTIDEICCEFENDEK